MASSMKCIYLLGEVDSMDSLAKFCFDIDSPMIRYSQVNASYSDSLFFSKISDSYDLNGLWYLTTGIIIFFMQCGFTMLEAGAVKNINVQNILFKNLMDTCICTLSWYLFGYTVAYGVYEDSNDFIGAGNAALSQNNPEDYVDFFVQWAFCITATTIVSGSVADRCRLLAYGIYTILLTIWVYPVVAHWIWSEHGWLSAFNTHDTTLVNGGIIDFAGCAAVHTVGGWAGLMGAIFLGPRIGRYKDPTKKRDSQYDIHLAHEHKFGNNVSYQVMGLFFLWFGWYGFNCGSINGGVNGQMDIASKVAVNTTLSAAIGGLTNCVLHLMIEGYWSVPNVVNGTLAGLVSITAACPIVGPGSAIAIGLVGAVFYFGASKFLEKVRIDDPLNAFPVHGVCGPWGLLSVAFFSNSKGLEDARFNDTLVNASRGELFSNQLFACVIVILWTIFWVGGLFGILKYFNLMRVTRAVEREGLDAVSHGGKAVDFARLDYVDPKNRAKFKQQTSVFNVYLENKKSNDPRKTKSTPTLNTNITKHKSNVSTSADGTDIVYDNDNNNDTDNNNTNNNNKNNNNKQHLGLDGIAEGDPDLDSLEVNSSQDFDEK